MIRKLAATVVTGMLATTLALTLTAHDDSQGPALRTGSGPWDLVWHP